MSTISHTDDDEIGSEFSIEASFNTESAAASALISVAPLQRDDENTSSLLSLEELEKRLNRTENKIVQLATKVTELEKENKELSNDRDELSSRVKKLELRGYPNNERKLAGVISTELVEKEKEELNSKVKILEQGQRLVSKMVKSLAGAAQEASKSASQGVNEVMERIVSIEQRMPIHANSNFNNMQVSPLSEPERVTSTEQRKPIYLRSSAVGNIKTSRTIFSEEESSTCLSEDTFAFMKVQMTSKKSFILAYIVYAAQMLLLSVILAKQVADATGTTLFNVPFRSDIYTRVGQVIAILLVVATSKDVVMPPRELSLLWISNYDNWGKLLYSTINDSNKLRLWLFYIVIPNVLQFIEGMFVLTVSFVIIIQSEDIVELFQNFAAVSSPRLLRIYLITID